MNTLFEPLLRVIVSNSFGLGAVGFLDVGLRVRNVLWGLVSRVQYPLFPYLAKSKDPRRTLKTLERATHFTVLLVYPLAILVAGIARPLCDAWIGLNDVGLILSVAVIPAAFLLASSPVTPHYLYLLSSGQASKTIWLQLLNASVAFTVLTLTRSLLEYPATLLGICLAIFSSMILQFYYQRREFGRILWLPQEIGLRFGVVMVIFGAFLWLLVGLPLESHVTISIGIGVGAIAIPASYLMLKIIRYKQVRVLIRSMVRL
jgi:O-antigen/teichoic acid export membrane protein